MQVVLFEPEDYHGQFLPLTHTRAVSSLRTGIFTLAERWHHATGSPVAVMTTKRLQSFYTTPIPRQPYFVHSGLFPSKEIMEQLTHLPPGFALRHQGKVIAYHGEQLEKADTAQFIATEGEAVVFERLWDLVNYTPKAMVYDLAIIKKRRLSHEIHDPFTAVYAPQHVFVEEGVTIRHASINATAGPVYIGKNARILEGARLNGPCAILEGASVAMNGMIRENTVVGPQSTIGGEVKNTIFQGFTNKAHEGYLGNSYIGAWVNFGAGTTSSNLKNTRSDVRYFDEQAQKEVSSGQQKLGVLMGDYSHTAIGTLLNTGTVISLFCHVMEHYMQPKYLPPFSWGAQRYEFEKALSYATRIHQSKGVSLKEAEKQLLNECYYQKD